MGGCGEGILEMEGLLNRKAADPIGPCSQPKAKVAMVSIGPQKAECRRTAICGSFGLRWNTRQWSGNAFGEYGEYHLRREG
jgi:hypothetical protein